MILSQTESVCPECLAKIPAVRIAEGDRVTLEKSCPKHGPFHAVIWRGAPSYDAWNRPKSPCDPPAPLTSVDRGCPWDCGLCPEHRQRTCCVLIEVTRRCNLGCSICYADAGDSGGEDPDLGTIKGMYEALLAAGGPFNVQLSGGEPTLRDDLPEIVSLGHSFGFDFIQVNTNGLRLAREPAYVEKLKEAGLSCVFLQFDGLDDDIYLTLRGRPLFENKDRAIRNCVQNDLGVILVPTLIPGINVRQIGSIIDYGLSHVPGVRGVHFQPVTYFGRYPKIPQDEDRLTLPEIISEIEKQMKGSIRIESFKPPGAENCYCSFHGNFVLLPDGELRPWTVHNPGSACCLGAETGQSVSRAQHFQKRFWASSERSCCPSEQGLSLGGWGLFLERVRTHSFCISGMAFQDAWNLDLDRLRECHLHVLHPDGRLVPFCAYNLTDSRGRSVYRNDSQRICSDGPP